jgi:AraC family transcriptional regulator, L-rhamnose operon regulatory protein RhaS
MPPESRVEMSKKISNKDVLEFYYPITLLPEVPVLGWQRFSQGTPGGPRPSKLKTYEICFVDKGSVEWWIDNQLFEAGAKSLFINKPGEWHGGASGLIQPCEMYFVQFNFPPESRLPSLTNEAILELKQAFETMHYRSFLASAEIKLFFDLLLQEQRNPQPYSLMVARAAFHQILITTLRDHTRKDRFSYSESVAKALSWIKEHLEQDIYSETLAEQAGMGVANFYKLFLQEVGLTPADYHLRQRIMVAKQKLRSTNMSITDIALELGLSSSQYFATVFKKVVGVTPKDYRQLRKHQGVKS